MPTPIPPPSLPSPPALSDLKMFLVDTLTLFCYKRNPTLINAFCELHGKVEIHTLTHSYLKSASLFQEVCFGMCEGTVTKNSDQANILSKTEEVKHFSPRHWAKLIVDLASVRELFLRNDASRICPPRESVLDSSDSSGPTPPLLPNDPTTNEELSTNSAFTNDFENIKSRANVFLCLSILRQHVTEEKTTHLKSKEVTERYSNQIKTCKFTADIEDLLQKILKSKDTLSIADFLASEKLFDVSTFQDKWSSLLSSWEVLALGKPKLLDSGNETQLASAMVLSACVENGNLDVESLKKAFLTACEMIDEEVSNFNVDDLAPGSVEAAQNEVASAETEKKRRDYELEEAKWMKKEADKRSKAAQLNLKRTLKEEATRQKEREEEEERRKQEEAKKAQEEEAKKVAAAAALRIVSAAQEKKKKTQTKKKKKEPDPEPEPEVEEEEPEASQMDDAPFTQAPETFQLMDDDEDGDDDDQDDDDQDNDGDDDDGFAMTQAPPPTAMIDDEEEETETQISATKMMPPPPDRSPTNPEVKVKEITGNEVDDTVDMDVTINPLNDSMDMDVTIDPLNDSVDAALDGAVLNQTLNPMQPNPSPKRKVSLTLHISTAADDDTESEELITEFAPSSPPGPTSISKGKQPKKKSPKSSKAQKNKSQKSAQPATQQIQKSILKKKSDKENSSEDKVNSSFESNGNSTGGRVDRIRPLSEKRPSAKSITFDDSEVDSDSSVADSPAKKKPVADNKKGQDSDEYESSMSPDSGEESSQEEWRRYQQEKADRTGSKENKAKSRAAKRALGIDLAALDSQIVRKKPKSKDTQVNLQYNPPKQQPKKRTKSKWTAEEEHAVKEGFKRFSAEKNCWAMIREEYSEILQNRTGVQIKDKWRTITRQMEQQRH